MQRYSDEYLHHWGEIFTDNHIGSHTDAAGNPLTFEQFLKAPEAYLYAIAFEEPLPTPGRIARPLLPRQQAVQRQLDWEASQARQEPTRPIRLAGFALIQRLNPFAPPKYHSRRA